MEEIFALDLSIQNINRLILKTEYFEAPMSLSVLRFVFSATILCSQWSRSVSNMYFTVFLFQQISQLDNPENEMI